MTPANDGVYRVELVCVYSWTEYIWTWTVYERDGDESLWEGTALTKFGARYAANRAVRKLRRGKSPKKVSDRDTYYTYP